MDTAAPFLGKRPGNLSADATEYRSCYCCWRLPAVNSTPDKGNVQENGTEFHDGEAGVSLQCHSQAGIAGRDDKGDGQEPCFQWLPLLGRKTYTDADNAEPQGKDSKEYTL